MITPQFIWLIFLLPVFSFIIISFFVRPFVKAESRITGYILITALFTVLALSIWTLLSVMAAPHHEIPVPDINWVVIEGGVTIHLGLIADSLTAVMLIVVTLVSLMVQIYSQGYMHGDPGYHRYFAWMSLFTASMLGLVLADNLLFLFVFWELVGLCSYLLIGFWFHKPEAADAAKKAFIVTRLGDFGFLAGILLLYLNTSTFDIHELHKLAITGALASAVLTWSAIGIFAGAVGKSAQFPLHIWLPDAMEGPTPVSAMVHAATMVTSGVYLLVRMNNVLTDDALIVIAVVGAATALFAALCAVAQHDIKKVLAYSTISQLGYMFLAIGSGAYVAAIFHVITHAFFKALLFLGSGSVIHGMGDEQDMRKMGALRLAMPITAATFIAGWLAIAGVPPFAGFWSKDEILLAAWEQKNIGPLLWFVGLITALLTAYYMSRQVFLVFFGDQRWDEEAHPHESSWTMTTPLCILAGAAIIGGAINLPLVKDWLVLEHFLEPVFNHPHQFSSGTITKVALAVISVCAGLAGISIAVLSWLTRRIPTDRLEPEFLENAMHVDSTYARVVGGIGTTGFQAAADIDKQIVDGAVNGVGKLTMRMAQFIRPAQSGYIRNYAIGVAVGALAIVVLLTWGLLL